MVFLTAAPPPGDPMKVSKEAKWLIAGLVLAGGALMAFGNRYGGFRFRLLFDEIFFLLSSSWFISFFYFL